MDEIHLNLEELEKINRIVKAYGVKKFKVICDSNGIGSCVSVEIDNPDKMVDIKSVVKFDITNYEKW